MRIKFLLVCLIMLSMRLVAQDKTHIVKIDIPKPMEGRSFYCTEVIDKRIDTSKIGYVFKGLGNKRAVAQLDGEFEIKIKKVLDELLLSEKDKEGLVFIFHELYINEKNDLSMERTLCRMEIEIARRKAGQLYSLGIFDQQLIGSAVDVTKLHSRGITLALKKCINAFSETDWRNNDGTLIEEDKPKYNFDFRSIPPKGVYTSFGQMARGIPLVTGDFEMETKKPSAKVVKYQCSLNEPLSKYVKYISDGKDLYFYVENESQSKKKRFVKVKHFGKYMYIEAKFSDPDALFLFGIIGFIASNKKRAIVLDTSKNELQELGGYVLHEITKGVYPEVLKTFKKSRRKLADLEAAIVQLNQLYLVDQAPE